MGKPIFCIFVCEMLMMGCATTQQEPAVTLPPISEPQSKIQNSGQIIWHDLATRDLDQAKNFYSGVFGWKFRKLNQSGREYTAIYLKDKIIGGMFKFTSKDREDPYGEWLVNLSSSNVAGDAEKFARAGGEILEPAREIPDRGTSAFVQDPYEAVFILTNSSSGDPEKSEVPVGGWLWNELWTHDATAALSLYQGIFGLESEKMKTPTGNDYYVLIQQSGPVGGILEMKVEDVRPHWVPYIRVSNIQSSISKALELGGVVLIGPQEQLKEGTVALLQGPTGEPFVIQEFEFESK